MMPFMLGTAAVKLCKKYDIPVTAGFHMQAENFTSHVFMKDNPLANQITYHTIYRNVYRHVDAVHYPTEFIRNVFEQAVHHRTNGYVISNGVGERFKPIKIEKPAEFANRFVIIFRGVTAKRSATACSSTPPRCRSTAAIYS